MEQIQPQDWAALYFGLVILMTFALMAVVYVLSDASNPTTHNQLDDPSPRSKYTAATNYQPPTPMSQALPNCPSFNVKPRYQNQRTNKIPNLFSRSF